MLLRYYSSAMFTGGGVRFHAAVALLIQYLVVVVACHMFMVSPDVVGTGSEYFVVYFRIYFNVWYITCYPK